MAVKLVIKDGVVIAHYREDAEINEEPGAEVVIWTGTLPQPPSVEMDTPMGRITVTTGPNPDPRTPEERANAYQDRRRLEYPSMPDQLDMLYWDQVNGTTVWRDTIAGIKAKHPKPSAKS